MHGHEALVGCDVVHHPWHCANWRQLSQKRQGRKCRNHNWLMKDTLAQGFDRVHNSRKIIAQLARLATKVFVAMPFVPRRSYELSSWYDDAEAGSHVLWLPGSRSKQHALSAASAPRPCRPNQHCPRLCFSEASQVFHCWITQQVASQHGAAQQSLSFFCEQSTALKRTQDIGFLIPVFLHLLSCIGRP
jgi:hypothetical protein